MKPVWVLRGEGINCEQETAEAFRRAGAEPRMLHARELCARPSLLLEAPILALPGGFSFGDEITSGQVLGLMLRQALAPVWPEFLARQGLVIGVCNGFQVLAKMGVFGPVSLVHNRQGHFIDQWVHTKVEGAHCIWTRGLEGQELHLPMRHGEGRLWAPTGLGDARAALTYTRDVNGSYQQIAGLTDVTGQILGLMPHPEAALRPELHPTRDPRAAESLLKIFHNAVHHAQEIHA
jgi:phosphoribosylformylglycinamidine (FGAM) synthase-like amidotransferase family enzyme